MSSITETPLARCSLSFAGSAPVLGSFKSALAKYDEVHVAFGNAEPVVTTMRKTNLARLLARRVDGIHLAPFEQGETAPGARRGARHRLGRVFRPFHSSRQFLWLVDRLIGELAAQTANPPVAVQPVIGRAVTVKG